MPKTIKKRVTKKAVPKEVEIKGAATEFLDLLREKRRQLILILSVAGAIIVLFAAFMLYRSSLSEEARSLEMEAYNYYYGINLKDSVTAEERWKKAFELYKKSIRIKATPTAQFYLGNCYYNLGEYPNAIKEYNTFLDRFHDQEELLPLVYQKLASAYSKANEVDKAISTLGTLAQLRGGIFRDTALILEARYYETMGEQEKALKKYEEIASKFPASPWNAEARARITALEKKGSEKQQQK